MPAMYPALPPKVYYNDENGQWYIARRPAGMTLFTGWQYLDDTGAWGPCATYFAKAKAEEMFAMSNGEEYIGSIWDDL